MITTVNLISCGGSTNKEILMAQKLRGKLYGLVRNLAIICNNSKAEGIQRAIGIGFPDDRIYRVSRAKGDLGEQIAEVLMKYKPNFYHLLGWMPQMPDSVTKHFVGLNQHLGPGGPKMYGLRRIYAHMRFCQFVRRVIPIPIFCQYVDPLYDQGDAIYVEYADFSFNESYEGIANRLLPIEHRVQIEALRRLALGIAKREPVSRVYEPGEEGLMESVILEADEYYTQLEKKEKFG